LGRLLREDQQHHAKIAENAKSAKKNSFLALFASLALSA
jgi:hypothetical protein